MKGGKVGKGIVPRIQPRKEMYIREQRRLLVLRRFVREFRHRGVQEPPGGSA